MNAARKALSLVYAWKMYISGDSVSTGMHVSADMHVRVTLCVYNYSCYVRTIDYYAISDYSSW